MSEYVIVYLDNSDPAFTGLDARTAHSRGEADSIADDLERRGVPYAVTEAVPGGYGRTHLLVLDAAQEAELDRRLGL